MESLVYNPAGGLVKISGLHPRSLFQELYQKVLTYIYVASLFVYPLHETILKACTSKQMYT